jgi:entericidin B
MNGITKAILSTAVCALVGAAITGCNTVKGAGRDIERGGEKVQGAADGAKDN